MMQGNIDSSWLSRPSTQVAPDLVGCTLIRQLPDGMTHRGLIVETEAYEPNDPAMHAYRRRTDRNQIMFGVAGRAYVYQIYGFYHCLNVVTDQDGVPSAVLIRALELNTIPDWIDPDQALKSDPSQVSQKVPSRIALKDRIAAGPGKLCLAFKIDVSLNATLLQPGEPLWLEHRTPFFQEQLNQGLLTLTQTTRIGLTKGVDLPWRWYLSNSPAVSKKAKKVR